VYYQYDSGKVKRYFYYLSSSIIFKIKKRKPTWIWKTLKQLSDKYLLTGMESKTRLMDAVKWRVKTTKSPKHTLWTVKTCLL